MKLIAAVLLAASTISVMAACSAPTPTPTVAPKAPPPVAAKPAPGGKVAVKTYTTAPQMVIDPAKDYTATIVTNMGELKAQLFAKESPRTVNNFVFLARDKFYDNVKFHRIIKGFMAQTGDPEGTGRGGPGYRFADELDAAKKTGYKRGVLAMANAGPNTNGSQFFIMHQDYALPANYSVFGQVFAGIETVDKIVAVPADGPERSSPTVEVLIQSVTIDEK